MRPEKEEQLHQIDLYQLRKRKVKRKFLLESLNQIGFCATLVDVG